MNDRAPATPEDEARLMAEVAADAPGAFETLVVAYQVRLGRLLEHVVGRRDEAEDLAQEVFLRVHRARRRYRPEARLSTWLFTIAHNVARNHLRSRARRPARSIERTGAGAATSTLGLIDGLMSHQPGASTQLRRVELSEVVRAAIATLGEDQREAVLLNKFEGLGYAEIAVVMGRSEAAVKSLLARARFQLREKLSAYLDVESPADGTASWTGGGARP